MLQLVDFFSISLKGRRRERPREGDLPPPILPRPLSPRPRRKSSSRPSLNLCQLRVASRTGTVSWDFSDPHLSFFVIFSGSLSLCRDVSDFAEIFISKNAPQPFYLTSLTPLSLSARLGPREICHELSPPDATLGLSLVDPHLHCAALLLVHISKWNEMKCSGENEILYELVHNTTRISSWFSVLGPNVKTNPELIRVASCCMSRFPRYISFHFEIFTLNLISLLATNFHCDVDNVTV